MNTTFTLWNNLPEELQKYITLLMEPRDIAHFVNLSSQSKKNINDYFWSDYFSTLNNINNALMEIGQHNPSLIYTTYQIASKIFTIDDNAISTLLYFAVMVKDDKTIDYLKTQFSPSVLDRYDDPGSPTINPLYIVESRIRQLSLFIVNEINNSSPKNIHIDIQYAIKLLYFHTEYIDNHSFVASWLTSKVKYSKLKYIISIICNNPHRGSRLISDIIKSYCYYQELGKLIDILDILMKKVDRNIADIDMFWRAVTEKNYYPLLNKKYGAKWHLQ